VQYKIINKIEQRVNEYQHLHGSTKLWIADKVGISKSRMYKIFKSDDMMISVYLRFSIVLQCPLSDLVEFHLYSMDDN